MRKRGRRLLLGGCQAAQLSMLGRPRESELLESVRVADVHRGMLLRVAHRNGHVLGVEFLGLEQLTDQFSWCKQKSRATIAGGVLPNEGGAGAGSGGTFEPGSWSQSLPSPSVSPSFGVMVRTHTSFT